MSFLSRDGEQYIPQGHPDASIQSAGTIQKNIGPARQSTDSIEDRSAPMRVAKTSPHATVSKGIGPAQRNDSGFKTRKTDVMVRSGNQEGKQTGVPDGFIWGLQGEGDAPAPAKDMPGLLKLGLVAGLGWVVYNTFIKD